MVKHQVFRPLRQYVFSLCGGKEEEIYKHSNRIRMPFSIIAFNFGTTVIRGFNIIFFHKFHSMNISDTQNSVNYWLLSHYIFFKSIINNLLKIFVSLTIIITISVSHPYSYFIETENLRGMVRWADKMQIA